MRPTVIIVCLFTLIGVLLIVKINAENILVVDGFEYSSVLDEISKMHHENIQLKEQIDQAKSLTTIYEKALQAGFMVNTNVLYLYERR